MWIYTGNKLAKFHGSILSLSENIAKSFRGATFLTHTVWYTRPLTGVQSWTYRSSTNFALEQLSSERRAWNVVELADVIELVMPRELIDGRVDTVTVTWRALMTQRCSPRVVSVHSRSVWQIRHGYTITSQRQFIHLEIASDINVTRNSSGDERANVNFLYDDIVHALQNTIDSCMNSASDRRGGYVLERMFTKFSEITQYNGHYAVQGHSRSPILVSIDSWYTTSY